MGLKEELSKELTKGNSIYIIKANLLGRGYLEEDINSALRSIVNVKVEESNKNNKLLSWKELFDRIGYGFASQQFINILFVLSGASLFLVGFTNGIKTAIVYLLSGFLKEYSRIKYFGKTFISTGGIIYGFSFLGMAFAVVLHSPIFFLISLLVGAIGVIAHGDLYISFFNAILKNERRKTFLKFISYFGMFITAASLMIAGFLMELFPVNGIPFSINPLWLNLVSPINFKIYGYLIAFEITAIMFILSGYLMSFIDEKKDSVYGSTLYISAFMREYVKEATSNSRIFVKNKKVILLTFAAMLFTIAQVVGNSYFGIFIYENFKHQFLGGFMNVAVIFVIALITSLSGVMLTKTFAKSLGEAPMLVFGTLLVSLLPLTMYFNPNLYAIGLSVALSIIGGAVVGVAQGLIAERLMDDKELSTYFTTMGFFSIIPTIVLVTLGALIAQMYSLQKLFLVLGIVLALVVMPIYFILVVIIDAEYRRDHVKK
jgi:MFS family permease